jgi:hypothetical protein
MRVVIAEDNEVYRRGWRTSSPPLTSGLSAKSFPLFRSGPGIGGGCGSGECGDAWVVSLGWPRPGPFVNRG